MKRRTRRSTRSCARAEAIEPRVLLSAADPSQSAFASIDGTGNNIDNPDLGSVDTELLRLADADYGDGFSTPAGEDRPSAREISNALAAVEIPDANDRYLTDIFWVWGQFIDHDIDLTENALTEEGTPAEAFPIEVPTGDAYFDPVGTGEAVIDFNRSVYVEGDDGLRDQINQITAFIDGSVIYGSDDERAAELRTFEGGLLMTSEGDLLPYNEAGLENAGGPFDSLFLAGDVRANENVALTAMHTIWVREHNRIAAELAAENSALTDENLYLQARQIVSAELQAITFNEFLPALFGTEAISDYAGYDPTVDPSIANEFSTAAYRFGHTLLSSELLRLDENGDVADEGNLALLNAFFNPSALEDNGVDSILRGATVNVAQELDNEVVDDVRNFLFGPPGSGGFDLASLNIQRGRDHGLNDYNSTRVALDLTAVESFSDISSDQAVAEKLEVLYGTVDNIDLWVGGLAEDHLPGSSMGETFSTIIIDQFERLRDGDRFWYENILSGSQIRQVESTTLADVIERNSNITGLQEHVFYSPAVLYVNVGAARSKNVTVRASEERIEVIDDRDGTVIADAAVAETDRVMLVGSQGRRERFTIAAMDPTLVAGGVVVDMGRGSRDMLRVNGTAGADVIVVDENVVHVGTANVEFVGVDRLVVNGLRGHDEISVTDEVTTGVRLNGGHGNDRLRGGRGNDRLDGGRGDDLLDGNDGDDELFGREGNDRLLGRRGRDRLSGGAGRDRLDGGQAEDRLHGGSGNDDLRDNSGRDSLDGGSGRDTHNGHREPPTATRSLFATNEALDRLFDEM